MYFKNQIRFTQIKQVLPRAHIEMCKGKPIDNINYCSKQAVLWEEGEKPPLAMVAQWVNIKQMIEQGCTIQEIFNEYPGMVIRYKGNISYLINMFNESNIIKILKQEYENNELRYWQKEILEKLKCQNDRQILWVWDAIGNIGKSYLAGYIQCCLDAYMVSYGKTADIAYAWRRQEYIVCDFSRQKQETINYELLESFKNGKVFSAKYDSGWKIRDSPCKVVCFANWRPDTYKLSKDRWCVIEITNFHINKNNKNNKITTQKNSELEKKVD